MVLSTNDENYNTKCLSLFFTSIQNRQVNIVHVHVYISFIPFKVLTLIYLLYKQYRDFMCNNQRNQKPICTRCLHKSCSDCRIKHVWSMNAVAHESQRACRTSCPANMQSAVYDHTAHHGGTPPNVIACVASAISKHNTG